MSPPTRRSARHGAAAPNQAQEDVAFVAMLPPPTKKSGVNNSEQVVAADPLPPKSKKRGLANSTLRAKKASTSTATSSADNVHPH